MKNMNRYFQKSLLNHPSIVHGGKTLSIVWASAHLRPRGSMMLQGSRIMSAPGILWSTPPVHISGERHWKARHLVWKLIFLLSGGSEVVWWLLLLRRPHPWALCLTVSSLVSSLSLLCLVSLTLGAILWPSELLYSCVCFSTLRCVGVLILWVCFLYF